VRRWHARLTPTIIIDGIFSVLSIPLSLSLLSSSLYDTSTLYLSILETNCASPYSSTDSDLRCDFSDSNVCCRKTQSWLITHHLAPLRNSCDKPEHNIILKQKIMKTAVVDCMLSDFTGLLTTSSGISSPSGALCATRALDLAAICNKGIELFEQTDALID
jgi:hypothetical protein